MSIRPEGYQTVFENQVYSKDIALVAGNEKPIQIRAIVIPKWYTEPTEDQVIDYIKQRADGVSRVGALVLPGGAKAVNQSALEQLLGALPVKVLTDIRGGDKGCLDFLRRNTNAMNLKEGENPVQYINLRYGTIPVSVITQNQEKGNVDGPGWYDIALSNEELLRAGFGQKWSLKLRLEDKRQLPDIREVDVLLKHQVSRSRTINIDNPNYDIEEVGGVVQPFYIELAPSKIHLLKDISKEVLESFALQPVQALHMMVRQQVIGSLRTSGSN